MEYISKKEYRLKLVPRVKFLPLISVAIIANIDHNNDALIFHRVKSSDTFEKSEWEKLFELESNLERIPA
jgi:hypothetical protein